MIATPLPRYAYRACCPQCNVSRLPSSSGGALSDGAYQAALYDCAVLPDYQGKGIGRMIIDAILKRIADCNIILYASPGKETFYERFSFQRMRTGMALFLNPGLMRQRGFITQGVRLDRAALLTTKAVCSHFTPSWLLSCYLSFLPCSASCNFAPREPSPPPEDSSL
ncbi:MAG: GNAT family N-acetyltransferase [Deltaproteobacteria bacterium]|nr:GNAT family N-acetyltransferase [Deltaproteobacteria bacterium]